MAAKERKYIYVRVRTQIATISCHLLLHVTRQPVSFNNAVLFYHTSYNKTIYSDATNCHSMNFKAYFFSPSSWLALLYTVIFYK